MRLLPRGKAIVLGCAVVALANAAMLGGAAWNRGGARHTTLTLTERELAMPDFRESDDSGILLSLLHTGQPPRAVMQAAWSRRYRIPAVEYPWLDRAKLGELGLAVELDPADPAAAEHYAWVTPRRCYAAFEFDGPAFRDWIAGRERQVAALREQVQAGSRSQQDLTDALVLLELDRLTRSRLLAVDAGRDPEELRRKYAEPGRHLILPAVVEPKLMRAEGTAPRLTGTISLPEMPDVYVPVEWYGVMKSFLPPASSGGEAEQAPPPVATPWPAAVPPRYGAAVGFGRKFEPWLVSLSATEKMEAPEEILRRTGKPRD